MNGQRRRSSVGCVEASAVRDRPTPMAVMNLANVLQVHPAIIAGRSGTNGKTIGYCRNLSDW